MSTSVGSSYSGDYFQAIYPGLSYSLAISAAEVSRPMITSGTTIMRLVATQACWISFTEPASPNSPGSFYFPGSAIEYLGIKAGQTVSVIRASTTDGFLYLTEGL